MKTRHKKFLNKIQLITTNFKGEVLASDKTLFLNWKEGLSIFEMHPFFEIITSLEESVSPKEKEFSFPCVHLSEEGGKNKICDVNITFELDEINIVIFDYSKAYYELNQISQQRNESVIKAQELEFSNRLLIEKEKFKNDFIASINHELTTPLTSINGFVELLSKTELDYEQEEIIRIIKSETTHLQTIFSDMLDISRIESGQFKLNKETFDFFELIKSIEESYKLVFEEKLLKFEVSLDSKINPMIFADKTRVYQIITNLLNNAIKYTPEGKIELSITKVSGKNRRQEIEIVVKDSGIGISKEDQKHIFEPFARVSDAVDGSGLGLSVTSNLVYLMEGEISLDSTLNEGTEFKVLLKFQNAQEKEIRVDEKEYKLKEGKKYRILVVENRINTQYLIMKQLLNNGSFFIDVVSTGEDAIKNIENRNYDLVILDIKLPGMSGFSLAKKIRNKYGDSAIKDIPILGISGIQIPNILNTSLSSGMDAFLSKPFSEEVLLKKITRLLAINDKG